MFTRYVRILDWLCWSCPYKSFRAIRTRGTTPAGRPLRGCQPVNRQVCTEDWALRPRGPDSVLPPSRHAAIGPCLWRAVSHVQAAHPDDAWRRQDGRPLVADREFIGADFFTWLRAPHPLVHPNPARHAGIADHRGLITQHATSSEGFAVRPRVLDRFASRVWPLALGDRSALAQLGLTDRGVESSGSSSSGEVQAEVADRSALQGAQIKRVQL